MFSSFPFTHSIQVLSSYIHIYFESHYIFFTIVFFIIYYLLIFIYFLFGFLFEIKNQYLLSIFSNHIKRVNSYINYKWVFSKYVIIHLIIHVIYFKKFKYENLLQK